MKSILVLLLALVAIGFSHTSYLWGEDNGNTTKDSVKGQNSMTALLSRQQQVSKKILTKEKGYVPLMEVQNHKLAEQFCLSVTLDSQYKNQHFSQIKCIYYMKDILASNANIKGKDKDEKMTIEDVISAISWVVMSKEYGG